VNAVPAAAPAAAPVSGWRSLRFLQLLLFVVASLLLLPLQVRFRLFAAVTQILILNGILVAISASGRKRLQRRLLIGVYVCDLALQAASLRLQVRGLSLTADAAGAVTIAIFVGIILDYVFRSSKITADTLFAAIVAYLFLAIAFSRAYAILHAVEPASFNLRPGASVDVELLYFSFVTIATLGYGDVVPRMPLTQMLAVIEAVAGQFYVAVLIAWLVSLYAGRRVAER